MASGTIAIIKLGLFYYDVLKGISLISMLNQVEFTLLEDVEGTTEYDFGGLNFKVTKYYMVMIFIIGEISALCPCYVFTLYIHFLIRLDWIFQTKNGRVRFIYHSF